MAQGTPLSTSKCSEAFAAVNESLNKAQLLEEETFVMHVADYVTEWNRLVHMTLSAQIKEAKEAKRQLDHYQKKVEALRLTTNKVMANGKQVKADAAEKLKRNEREENPDVCDILHEEDIHESKP